MIMKRILFLSCILIIIVSCDFHNNTYDEFLSPAEVRTRALYYAKKYIDEGAEYEWGGQDPLPKKLVVDCSGLIIRCYEYATADYGYFLLFEDTTSYGLKNYCAELNLDNVEPGDIIFMGDNAISHVALFVNRENGFITFIDSTYKPEEQINGVSERSYPESDPRFLCFGRLWIWKK